MRVRNCDSSIICNIIGLMLLHLVIQGCAVLQNTPVVELTPSRLTCDANPEMVDGDLQTVGTFRSKGSIRKLYHKSAKPGAATNVGDTQTTHSGSLKTDTLIKLDKPTYVAYIEIHAGSDIRKIAVDLTAEEKSPTWNNSFVPVADKRHTDIKNRQVVRFYIRQKVLYFRITADGIEDRKNRENITSDDPNYSHEIVTPLKGSEIREVKIYERL